MSRAPARAPHIAGMSSARTIIVGLTVTAVLSISGLGAQPASAQKSSTTVPTSVPTTKRTSSTTAAYRPSTNGPTTVATSAVTLPSTTSPQSTEPSTVAPSSGDEPMTAATLADAGGVQPFPAPLVGPVPAAEVPVERLMTNVYMTASTDPQRPQVVVQFKSPFTLPARPYRVSVLVGDPAGAQLRASMIGNAGTARNGVSWKLEKAPQPGIQGGQLTPVWATVDSNDTGATFSASGLVAITVPLPEAPEGPAVWAEVESGSDGTQVSITPYFSRAAIFDTAAVAQLPSSTVGTVLNADGTQAHQSVNLPPGPVLSLVDKGIALDSPERAPTELLGQKVEKAFDFVRIAPTFNQRAIVTDYVFIDRTTGDVKLLDGFSVPPADRTGSSEWVRSGPAKPDPGAPGRLSFDLRGISLALGTPMSAGATGFGVRREFILADGRRVVAEAVLGTVGWFGADQIEGIDQPVTSPIEGPPLGPLTEEEARDTGVLVTAAALVGLVLLVVAAAVIIRVRRRRRSARGDAADQLDAIAVETQQHRALLREERRSTGRVPVAVAHVGIGDRDDSDTHRASMDRPQVDRSALSPDSRCEANESVEDVLSTSDASPLASDDVNEIPGDSNDMSDPAGATERSPRRRWGGAKPVIDADPVWADDITTSGGRAFISARSVRPDPGPISQSAEPAEDDVEPTPGAPAAHPTVSPSAKQSDRKLRSTFRDRPGTRSPQQPVARDSIAAGGAGKADRTSQRSPGAGSPAAHGNRVAPSSALASLGAEFDELAERLARLDADSTDAGTPS